MEPQPDGGAMVVAALAAGATADRAALVRMSLATAPAAEAFQVGA